MARWHVLHRRLWGENEAQFSMENLHVTFNKGENGPHELTYEISNYYEADLTQIIPYNIDFGLFVNDREIMSGMVTSVGFQSEQEYLSVAAKSYLHYLERRFYPYDASESGVNAHRVGDPPRGLAYEVTQEEVTNIIDVLLSQTMGESNSLDMTWDLTPTGHLTDYRIDLPDSENILSKIQQLSGQDPGIFDFWMDGKAFKIATPRRYPIAVLGDASLCSWTFTDSESGLLDVKFTNTGPEGNHVLGVGAGDNPLSGTGGPDDATADLEITMDDLTAQGYYRRLDAFRDFGDVTNRGRVAALTKGYFGHATYPTHEISIEVYTEAVKDFWFGTIYPGCAIWLDYTNGIYHLNSAYEVVSIDLEVNTETDEMVTLNLNQVYPFWEEVHPPIVVAPGTDINKPPFHIYVGIGV